MHELVVNEMTFRVVLVCYAENLKSRHVRSLVFVRRSHEIPFRFRQRISPYTRLTDDISCQSRLLRNFY